MNRADLKELLWATFGHLSATELVALVISGLAHAAGSCTLTPEG